MLIIDAILASLIFSQEAVDQKKTMEYGEIKTYLKLFHIVYWFKKCLLALLKFLQGIFQQEFRSWWRHKGKKIFFRQKLSKWYFSGRKFNGDHFFVWRPYAKNARFKSYEQFYYLVTWQCPIEIKKKKFSKKVEVMFFWMEIWRWAKFCMTTMGLNQTVKKLLALLFSIFSRRFLHFFQSFSYEYSLSITFKRVDLDP